MIETARSRCPEELVGLHPSVVRELDGERFDAPERVAGAAPVGLPPTSLRAFARRDDLGESTHVLDELDMAGPGRGGVGEEVVVASEVAALQADPGLGRHPHVGREPIDHGAPEAPGVALLPGVRVRDGWSHQKVAVARKPSTRAVS